MTQLQSRPFIHTAQEIEPLLQAARNRSARGNATRRDWERVAAIDPEVARREVYDYLTRQAAAVPGVNPYERRPGVSGPVAGFVIGVLAVAGIWLLLPWIRDTYISEPTWQHVITSGQFIATVLIPLGIFLGARWSQGRGGQQDAAPEGIPQDASLEDLLDRFERTQHAARARVY